jgi:vitamin B12 transporter
MKAPDFMGARSTHDRPRHLDNFCQRSNTLSLDLFRCVLAVVILFIPILVSAQASRVVTGQVTDPQNAVVAHARISLVPRERPADARITFTDDQGRYGFTGVPAGDYLLSVEAPGFARSVQRNVQVTNTGSTEVAVKLEIASVNAEVVVTASGTAQPVDEVSKAVTIVDDKQLHGRDQNQVADSLATVPGLRVQRLGGPGRLTSIKSRGLRSQDTAILLDGWRLRDTTAITGDASSFLGDLAVVDLDRVEVLRGSGSSLYGTNAIGGVVNLVTADGGGPLRGDVLLEGGGLGMFRGAARFTGGTANDRVIFSAGIQHLNFTRGIDGDDSSRNTAGQGRVLFRLNSKSTLSGYIYATDAFVQLNNSPAPILTAVAPGETEGIALSSAELKRYENGTPLGALQLNGANFIPDANDPDNSQKTRFFAGAARFDQRVTDTFGFTLSYSGVRTSRSNVNGSGGVGSQFPGRTDYQGHTNTFNARTDFLLGPHNSVTAGYEFEQEGYFNNNIQPFAPDNSQVRATQRSNTFFAQDQLRFMNERLQVSVGFRAQTFQLDQPAFMPTAGSPYQNVTVTSPRHAYTGDGSVAYLFSNRTTKIRAHVGNGYRVPSLYERFGVFYSSAFCAYCVYGDPRLQPERSIGVDGGIDQSLANGKVRLSASYFYTRLQSTIDFFNDLFPQPDPFGRTFGGYYNTNGRVARGVEVSMDAAPSRHFDVFTSYTFTNSDERTPMEPTVVKSFVIPDHQFTIVANQHWGAKWAFNESLVATSSHLFPFFVFDPNTFVGGERVFRFAGATRVDAGGSYTWRISDRHNVRFLGRVENLLNRRYFESGFRMPGITAKGGAEFRF